MKVNHFQFVIRNSLPEIRTSIYLIKSVGTRIKASFCYFNFQLKPKPVKMYKRYNLLITRNINEHLSRVLH